MKHKSVAKHGHHHNGNHQEGAGIDRKLHDPVADRLIPLEPLDLAKIRSIDDLVRAMSGLALGMGRGLNCGALSGGCCILGLYGGRANEDERVHPRYDLMIEQFTAWFVDAMAKKYGGVNCQEIINFDPKLMQQRCPGLILDCWRKIREILAEHRIDVAGPVPAVWEES